MKKVLVACADYPSEHSRALQYVHVRNKYYMENNIDVTVLNFAATKSYVYEGVKVISLDDFYKIKNFFSSHILICHAPNLRNHFIFIKKNKEIFENKIFFFHGHEIVKINKEYPKPYSFIRKNIIKRWMRGIYDCFKLKVWRYYFLNKDHDSKLIFVSNSLKNDFINYLKMTEEVIENRVYIINNCVDKIFERKNYECKSDGSLYDFITIRSNLDSSVYCIDLVTEIAKKNSDKSFLVIGMGKYFDFHSKPHNVILINRSMPQEELITYINSSRTALMPTRRDSQGVMACELATFGIPVVTSNLNVCKEMFQPFKNVYIFDDDTMINIIGEKRFDMAGTKNTRFFSKNTVEKEVKLIKSLQK